MWFFVLIVQFIYTEKSFGLIYLQSFSIFISLAKYSSYNSQHLLEVIAILNPPWQRAFIPPPLETISSCEQKHFTVKNSYIFPIMNKSTKIDIILSNFQHTSLFFIKPIICRFYKPRQIKFTSPKPSTTYYTLSSLAFTISFHVLAQPDFFTLRQNYSPFPSIIFFFLTYYQSTAFSLPSCFSDNTKTFIKIFKVVFFQ